MQQPQPTIGLEAELGTEEMEAELRRQLGIRGLREGEVHPTDTVNVKVMGDALTALQKRKGIWSAQQQIKTDELMGAVHMVMHQLKQYGRPSVQHGHLCNLATRAIWHPVQSGHLCNLATRECIT